MDYFMVWCNLKDTHKDLVFAQAVREYLSHLQQAGHITGFHITRRKLGFGPPDLGEFQIVITAESLAMLDNAFSIVAARTGVTEQLHARVYSLVRDLRTALYRDFPDPQRTP
jgi:hypothetical protein